MGYDRPAVKNGQLLRLVKGAAVRMVPFDGPHPNYCTADGIPIVTEGIAGGSTVGGVGFSVINEDVGLSTVTTIDDVQVVLLGAIVQDFDGFKGPVLEQHVCASDYKVG